jgi:hypothetical protein
MSVYGDIAVDYISPRGNVIRVSFIQGMAVYTPTPVRRLKVDFDKTLDIDYRKGKLHIVYTAHSDTKPEKLAEAELLLH